MLNCRKKNGRRQESKVLRMAQIANIKDLYENEGLSLREIAKQTGKDFRTVQKYAYQEDWNPAAKENLEPKKYPVLGEHIPTIDVWLEQDMREPRKQRHTIKRVYERLRDECGYRGSYASVKRYVNRKRDALRKRQEGFIPLAHPPGWAQVDFGKFKYYDAVGIDRTGWALIVSFPYSNAGWIQVFRSQNQECLLTGLKRIFYHIGGVPVRIRCDNMSTAVAQILEGTERILSDGFYRFMLHHRFEADFCNPAKGNEKGNVENKVGYTRRNMLVPVPTIEDFEEFNAELLCRCGADLDREHYQQEQTISGLWETERKHLLTLPEYEYDVFRYESLSVNKFGFVTVDTVRYGLPPEMSGAIVQAKIYFDRIDVYYDRQPLKSFTRGYERNTEVYDWKEYLPALMRKPGAVPHTRFFDQMPKLWQEHLKATTSRERRTALQVLMEMVNDGNESFCDEALELANENGRTDADSIRQCYYMIAKPESHPNPLTLASSPPTTGYSPDLSVYDVLTGGAA
jgi:transposase